jgi:hypothetical protein
VYIPGPRRDGGGDRRDGAGDFRNVAAGAAHEGGATMTAGRSTGGAPMSAVAARLASHRLKVTLPRRPDGRTLTITARRHLRCTLTLDDDGPGCEATIAPSDQATPAQIAPLAAHLLGTSYPDPTRHAHLHRGVTLAGAVARDLAAWGLHVRMDVIEDHDSYRAFADVIITNPTGPQRGRLHLSDDGWITWECDRDVLPGGTDGFTDTIAAALTHICAPTATSRLRRYVRLLAPRRHPQARPPRQR